MKRKKNHLESKIKCATQLARYQPGDRAWTLHFQVRQKQPPSFLKADWATRHPHPKHLYREGFRRLPVRRALPRMHAMDFCFLTHLLCSKLVIVCPTLKSCRRCFDTAEFYYRDSHGFLYAEGDLFPTFRAAKREHARVLAMLKIWLDSVGECLK